MITNEETVLDLIGHIYDASLDPGSWPAFLEKFADSTSGTTTTIFVQDLQAQRGSINAAIRFDPIYQRLYEEYYSKLNVWLVCEGAATYRQGQIVIGQAYVSDNELTQTEYYNDFLRRMNVFHTFGSPVIKEQSMLSVFTSLRPRQGGPYGAEESKLLSTLIPHLQRAIKLHHHFSQLNGTIDSSWELLEGLNLGVVVLNEKAKIMFINRTAEEFVAQKDGLAIQNGCLSVRAKDTVLLRKLISEAIQTSKGEGFGSGGEMHLQRPSMLRPYSISVCPFSRKISNFHSNGAYAMVFIQDLEEKLEPCEGQLIHLFRFSFAEAKLASRLLQGRSLSEAAREIQISYNTAHTQLKSIFLKTNTNSQSQLVRHLMSVRY